VSAATSPPSAGELGEKDKLRVDQVVLIYKGCQGERLYYPKPVLVGALMVKQWIDTKATRCVCGAETCDVKLRLEKPAETQP
jgi:hypothetical protein